MPTSVGHRGEVRTPASAIAVWSECLRRLFAAPRALAVAASIMAALIALSVVDSIHQYREARQQAEADAITLARLLAERSRGALGEVRTVMNAAAQGLRQPALADAALAARSLTELRSLEPALIGLTVFDMDARELAASRDFHAPPPEVPDHATLARLAAARGPDRGWGYGHHGDAASTGWFSMVRLVLADDGRPLGAVVAQVERELLRTVLDGIDLHGLTALLALRHREGGEALALRANVDEAHAGSMLALEPALKAVAHGNRSGSLQARLPDLDDREWLVGYELLERKDLVAVAWVGDHPALAAAHRAWVVKIARAVCAVALLAFVWTVGARRARRIGVASAAGGTDAAAADLLDATEGAQRRLALELHDGVCQQLTGARYLADACERRLRDQGHAQADEVRDLASLITASIDQTRAVVRGLQPVGDGSHGLAHALDDLCARTRATFGIDCRYIDHTSGADLGAAVANQVFRIAQEAISNAQRHGKATRIEVCSAWEGARYALEVWSDGAVPAVDTLSSGRGRGIPGMRLRAAHLGAELSFEHAPDDAFCVHLRLEPAAASA